MTNEYDVVVVGAGTGGYVAAIRAAQLGLAVAVVEKQKALGGTCLHLGLHSDQGAPRARARAEDRAEGEGVGRQLRRQRAAPAIDMTQVHARKDKIVTGLTKGVEFLFKKNKIDWIKGTARLTGNGGVDVFEGEQADASRAPRDHHRHRVGAAERSRHRDRSHTHHHERRGHRPARRADVDRDSRQRRRRRRVRLDLPPLRQRRDDPRAPAATRARGRRSRLGGAGEVVPEARHHEAHAGAKVTAARVNCGRRWSSRRSSPTALSKSSRADYLFVATGRGPVTTGLDVERLGTEPREGLHQGRYSLPDERARASPRSAT